MEINNIKIGKEYSPYIIGELSANHGGSITRAKESIKKAAEAGISAIKIQTYTPDTMTIKSDNPDFFISKGTWAGSTLYDLYKSAYTPYEWHKELFEYANDIGITIFSTPFDESAVDLLEELNTPAYKIASFEIVDLPLIEYIASKNKPILMSTGMANLAEIEEALHTIRKYNDNDILLFHCISSYPAPIEQSNLGNINYLKKRFKVEVGLSDHTKGNLAASVAIGIGAVAIEKHFKLDNQECGPDSSFSLNVNELSKLVIDCNHAWLAKGKTEFKRAEVEKENIVFRRSLYFVSDLKIGEEIKPEHIRRIRPGYGLPPKYLNKVLGKTVKKDIKRGDAVIWEVIQ